LLLPRDAVQAFIDWVLPAYVDGTVTPNEVRALFPVVWQRFLTVTDRTDVIHVELEQDGEENSSGAAE